MADLQSGSADCFTALGYFSQICFLRRLRSPFEGVGVGFCKTTIQWMLCDHNECTQIDEDVLNKYGNIFVFNGNHFQFPVSIWNWLSVQNSLWILWQSAVSKSLKCELWCFFFSFFFFSAILKHATSVILAQYCTLDVHSLKSHSIRPSRRQVSVP